MSPRFRNALASAAILALLAAGSGCGHSEASSGHAVLSKQVTPQGEVIRLVRNPEAAPAFELRDLDGRPLSLADARGKIVLLNFWATWCGPCRAEIPDLVDLEKRYADKLEIIALATEEDDADEVRRFVLHAGINYRVAMAPDGVVRDYGGIAALPTSFVIDREGRIVQKHVGLNDPSLYERELRAMLGMEVDAKIEYFEDNGQIFLKNAERATELPGVDFSALTARQKSAALRRMNLNGCNCGCSLTLAQCRINDTACRISLALAQRIVTEISGKRTKAPAAANADSSGQTAKPEDSPRN